MAYNDVTNISLKIMLNQQSIDWPLLMHCNGIPIPMGGYIIIPKQNIFRDNINIHSPKMCVKNTNIL